VANLKFLAAAGAALTLALPSFAYSATAVAAAGASVAPAGQERQETEAERRERIERGEDRAPRRGRGRARDSQPSPEQVLEGARALAATMAVDCQVSEATLLGVDAERKSIYEVVCANNAGHVLIASEPPQQFNCLELAGSAAIQRERDPAADVGQQCTLPANQNGQEVIGGWAREAGVSCTVDEARAVGRSTLGNLVYEVGCAGVDGYRMEKIDGQWNLQDCLQVVSVGGSCRFTTVAEQNSTLQAKLVGTDASDCAVQQVRVMGQNANGRFYEVKCAAEGVGYIARVKDNATQQVYACATAQAIGGGCTLTPAPAAAPAAAPAPTE